MKFKVLVFPPILVIVALLAVAEENVDTTCTEITASIAPPTDRDDDNTEMYDHKKKEQNYEPYPILHHN